MHCLSIISPNWEKFRPVLYMILNMNISLCGALVGHLSYKILPSPIKKYIYSTILWYTLDTQWNWIVFSNWKEKEEEVSYFLSNLFCFELWYFVLRGVTLAYWWTVIIEMTTTKQKTKIAIIWWLWVFVYNWNKSDNFYGPTCLKEIAYKKNSNNKEQINIFFFFLRGKNK